MLFRPLGFDDYVTYPLGVRPPYQRLVGCKVLGLGVEIVAHILGDLREAHAVHGYSLQYMDMDMDMDMDMGGDTA